MTKKTFDLGEYIVKIYHNDLIGEIRVEVLDENLTLLESIHIDENEIEDSFKIKFN